MPELSFADARSIFRETATSLERDIIPTRRRNNVTSGNDQEPTGEPIPAATSCEEEQARITAEDSAFPEIFPAELTSSSSDSPKISYRKIMLTQEPGWKLEFKDSGAPVLRKDGNHFKSNNARICFRCDVEVHEYEREYDYDMAENAEPERSTSTLAMLSSCVAALCVTIVLPWLLIGG